MQITGSLVSSVHLIVLSMKASDEKENAILDRALNYLALLPNYVTL